MGRYAEMLMTREEPEEGAGFEDAEWFFVNGKTEEREYVAPEELYEPTELTIKFQDEVGNRYERTVDAPFTGEAYAAYQNSAITTSDGIYRQTVSFVCATEEPSWDEVEIPDEPDRSNEW